jgi:hypothetical protein
MKATLITDAPRGLDLARGLVQQGWWLVNRF